MHLYIIRHGQSHVNLTDWGGGYIDAGLTEIGHQQAARLADWLRLHLTADALFASTLRRAAETAEYVARTLQLPLQPDDRLREIGNCWPDGSPVPLAMMPLDFYDFAPTTRPLEPVCKGGESWVMFVARVRAFIQEITARYNGRQAAVVLVCHSGIMDALVDIVFDVGQPRPTEVAVHNTGITHWEYTGATTSEAWLLHSHNLVYHLLTEQPTPLAQNKLLSGAPLPL